MTASFRHSLSRPAWSYISTAQRSWQFALPMALCMELGVIAAHGLINFSNRHREFSFELILLLRAACKTLIGSERRKNTQTGNDVRAWQLARF